MSGDMRLGDGRPDDVASGDDQDRLKFEPPHRRSGRRRLVIALVVTFTVLAILTGAAIAADFAARDIARDMIREQLRTSLGIPPATPIDVDVRGTSMLQQLITGQLERVDVSSQAVTFGDLTGALEVTAADIPLDQTKPVKILTVQFTVDDDQLGALSANLSGLPITGVRIDGQAIRADLEFSVFGQAIPLGIGVVPAVESGGLAFTPSEIRVFDATFSADELRRRFGAIGADALKTQNFCIAEYLPRALELKEAVLRDDDMLLYFNGSGAVLTGPDFSMNGTCG